MHLEGNKLNPAILETNYWADVFINSVVRRGILFALGETESKDGLSSASEER